MRIFLIGFQLILLTASIIPAQTLTMEELFARIAEYHPLIDRENLNVNIEQENRRRFLADQDWLATASPSFLHSELITTSSFSPERIDQLDLTASLQRSLWSTGGQLLLSLSSRLTDQSLPAVSFSPGGGPAISVGLERLYENSLSLNYNQPLLRNYRGRLDRLEYELADYTIDAARLQSLENQEQFLFEIGGKYLDWVLLEEQLIIARERLVLAGRQLDESTVKYEANLIDKVDVLRSEDSVRRARQSVVLIQSRITAQKAELAVLARDDSINGMTPDYDLYAIENFPDLDEACHYAVKRSRLIRAVEIRRDQLEERRKGFKETGRPALDLNIGAGLKGGDERYGESMVLDKPDFMASILFTHPLGRSAAESDIRRTGLELKQLKFERDKIALDLESAVTRLLIQITELESVLELNRREIDSARERTEEELKLYNQGRGDLAFVIQSQDNEQNARLLYAENAAAYHWLVLTYDELTDQILSTQ